MKYPLPHLTDCAVLLHFHFIQIASSPFPESNSVASNFLILRLFNKVYLFDYLIISNKSSNFIVSNYNIYNPFTAIFTDNKVTEYYCLADDFCKFFDSLQERYSLSTVNPEHKRCYYRAPKMPKAEVMLIIIIFHASEYRCLEYYYIQYVVYICITCFPAWFLTIALWNLKKRWLFPLPFLSKKVLLGKCIGIGFVDSTPLWICRNQCILMH